jgi:general secretion pathway protein E
MSPQTESSSDLTWHGDARAVVDAVLGDAVSRGASDIHVEPVESGYEVRYRIDGLLQPVASYGADAGRAVVGRLMVLANLLTYRVDLPQEGRLTFAPRAGHDRPVDFRLAIMPTAQGLRAAVRLPAELLQPRSLAELGLPAAVLDGCRSFAAADSGMLIVTGPAGSGKTTTIYAQLQYIVEASAGLSIVTLEDPVERRLRGVTQIEVKPFGELTYERCLRSILRQDPQVLMLGEIRDAATATLAVSAALSGHRMICTLHAATPGGAIARLLEMGTEPYQISSSLFGVIAQRLVRKGNAAAGYAGRAPVAEFAPMTEALRRAVLARSDASTLAVAIAAGGGHVDLRQAAGELVSRGVTDAAEVARILGR